MSGDADGRGQPKTRSLYRRAAGKAGRALEIQFVACATPRLSMSSGMEAIDMTLPTNSWTRRAGLGGCCSGSIGGLGGSLVILLRLSMPDMMVCLSLRISIRKA